jgi:hypothetical protein
MRPFIAIIFILACALPIRADNWLQNGDFADGSAHWRGDGLSAADMAVQDPLAKPDPAASHSLSITLQNGNWTKIVQDFRSQGMGGELTIKYRLSPGLTFSKTEEDYTNVTDKIHYSDWKDFTTPVKRWVVLVSDIDKGRGRYYVVHPSLDTKRPQQVKAKVTTKDDDDETITIAFPPGNGTVVILGVSLE